MNEKFWVKFLRKMVRSPEDVPVFIGTQFQKNSMFAAVRTWPLWRDEKPLRKAISLLRLRWQPGQERLRSVAHEIFVHEVFGKEQDLGPELLDLITWHQSQEWDLNDLTPTDIEKADALSAFTVSTRIRLSKFESSPTRNLRLAHFTPFLMPLPFAMIVKVPVISFQHFLDVDHTFAFNSIRASKHPYADDLISYLYEILFLQQKIAVQLHELISNTSNVKNTKKENVLMNSEVDAIMIADSVFSYLKASLEKTIAMVGLVFEVRSLDSMKTHKQKMAALNRAIPDTQKRTDYGAFLLSFVDSDTLSELNNFRAGLLHKKGISGLQPHKYVNNATPEQELLSIFGFLHQQHAKNTAVLLSSLALLTDQLVLLEPPKITPAEIFSQFEQSIVKIAARIMKAMEDFDCEDDRTQETSND